MKKYFMKGTEDELQFGDVIELDMVGKEDGKTRHTHLEVEFMPELVEELLKEDIIEEQEEEDDELLDFDEADYTAFREAVAQDIEDLSDADAAMKKRIAKLEEKVATLEELYRLLTDKKKTASSNKK